MQVMCNCFLRAALVLCVVWINSGEEIMAFEKLNVLVL